MSVTVQRQAWYNASETTEKTHHLDAISVGRRVRSFRKAARMTLERLSAAVHVAPSQLSAIENGKREPKLATLAALARALGTSVEELLQPELTRRAALEVEFERAQRGPLHRSLGVPEVRISPRLPLDALEALVALTRELTRNLEERAATPEEARRANTALRVRMRACDNYFGDYEQHAQEILTAVGYRSGPLSQHHISSIVRYIGFALHHVHDLPHSTRSVIDTKNRRIYLARSCAGHDPRSVLLQTVGHLVLGHNPPATYGEFLEQRVASNYFAAAVLMPQKQTVEFLSEARQARDIAIEDLRDAFGVSYEAAAHRFTNVATRHLGLHTHFLKVHESGVVHKAFENDGMVFPTDHTGAIEGQSMCKYWACRSVFCASDRLSAFHQYTDTPTGTYWCTAHTAPSAAGEFSVSVGVPYAQVKWFRGRDTSVRAQSSCPLESCCRLPPPDLAAEWAGHAWPSARVHSHLLAAMPTGFFPGVDETEVYRFLHAHASVE